MIYLIDFENVHEDGFSALGRLGDKDAVYCFFTKNVAKISMSALAGMRSGQLHFIEAESGKQSLDLVLVSYLGYLIGTRPQELYYDIVSNDNGFAKVAEFWNKRGNGLRVRIRKTNDLKAKTEPVRQQPENNGRRQQLQAVQKGTETTDTAPEAPADMPASVVTAAEPASNVPQNDLKADSPKQPARKQRSGWQRGSRQRGNKQQEQQPRAEEKKPEENGAAAQEQAKPAEQIAPTVADTSPSNSTPRQTETVPAEASDSAGITAADMEFVQAQAEKYRDDKNRKQLVYRAVVKKYGQKNGTRIYNSAKKLLLK